MNMESNYDDLDLLVGLLDDETSKGKNEEVPHFLRRTEDVHVDKLNKLPINSCSNEEDTKSEICNAQCPLDPLEVELAYMEEKMNKLKAELLKKKNISKSSQSKIGFTKFSGLVETQKETIRNLKGQESKELLQSLNKPKSELHTGETDSEDDEDNRNPSEQQLSSVGREIKKRLAYGSNESILTKRRDCRTTILRKPENRQGCSKEANGGSLFPIGNMRSSNLSEKEDKGTVDPFSGIKLLNPVISAFGMKELMDGRKMIQMSSIATHLRGGDIEGDWVTIGIIVSKSEPKKSQKGSQYVIWQLSDLRDCTKVVSLFLFANAYKELWKTTVGTSIGILNPQIMKERPNDQRTYMTLSISNHQNILMMGTSKDLGWCKGRTKTGPCRQFVNKNVCEFCVYHIQREYQKTSSKRAEIQSSFTRIDPRKALQNKVLGKDQVFYGGQLFSSNPEKKNVSKASKLTIPSYRAKDLTTLSSLKIKVKAKEAQEDDKKQIIVSKPAHMSNGQIASVKEVTKSNEEFGMMLLAPTPGALNLLKHISKEPEDIGSIKSRVPELSAKELLAATRREKVLMKNSVNSSKIVSPLLGRGFGLAKEFDLEVSPLSIKKNAAKFRAASVLQKSGGLKVQEKNMKRNREKSSTVEFQESIKKRIRSAITVNKDDIKEADFDETNATEPQFDQLKKDSLLGSININSEKFQSMIRAKSNHTSLIQAAEEEQVENYYNSLEKKEMLENKLVSTMEVPTIAVICLECKYKAITAAEHCRKENHPLKSIKAVKRFFECRNCKQRTVSLDKLPARPCTNCEQSSWKRAGMGKEKLCPKLDNEVLSLRGDELNHYCGTSNKVYLHL